MAEHRLPPPGPPTGGASLAKIEYSKFLYCTVVSVSIITKALLKVFKY